VKALAQDNQLQQIEHEPQKKSKTA
jgi:hypothetical protein